MKAFFSSHFFEMGITNLFAWPPFFSFSPSEASGLFRDSSEDAECRRRLCLFFFLLAVCLVALPPAPLLPLGPLAAPFALLSNERSSTHSLSFVSFYSFSVPSIGRTMLLIPAQTCCIALSAVTLRTPQSNVHFSFRLLLLYFLSSFPGVGKKILFSLEASLW